MNEYYKIRVEVRDKDLKIIEDSKGFKQIELKFEWFVRSVDHMEWLMRDLHRTLKAWMPENQIWIEAGIMGGIDSDPRLHTLSIFYSYYGPEDRFVIHT